MMKKLLMFLTLMAFTVSLSAQVTLYDDDFESYTVGQGIAAQSEWWIIWPNMPDAPVVTEQANSGTNSIKFIGTNDVILILDKVAGKYQVDFYYYINSGFAGYFNFQRLPTPGVEWVCEVYFENNGTGVVHAGGLNAATFTYSQNQWVHVKNIIDLDEDEAELYINNNLIHTYQWSLTSQGATSPHGSVLGGLNIFAGAPTGQTPSFYMDDVAFIELVSGNLPEIVVTPDEFTQEISIGEILTDELNVSNIGNTNLNYDLEINYVFPDMKRGNRPLASMTSKYPDFPKGIASGMAASSMSHTAPSEPSFPEDEVTLNYDGPNEGSVGLTAANEWEVAARFPNSMTVPHAGMELTKVAMYIAHTDDCSFKIRIYGEGTSYAPGELLHEQVFDPTFPDWYTITLTEPITITGEDLWVGYWIDQTLPSIYPAGSDAGPAHPEGDYIKTGAGWGHIAPNLDYNWNIRAILDGDVIMQWLSVDPVENTLAPNEDEDHVVTYNALGLELDDYEAVIKVKSNDPNNGLIVVPVTLNVTGTAGPPVIGVEPSSLYEEILAGYTSTQELLLENSGPSALTFNVEIEFPDKVKKSTIHDPVPQGESVILDLDLAMSANGTTGGQPQYDESKNTVVIHYDGDNADAIGLTGGGTFSVAARFPAAMMGDYEGYTLEEVDVYINSLPSSSTFKVWGAGTSTAPGALLHEQDFVPFFDSWYTITLSDPLLLTGNDLWIGYTVTHGASEFPAGCDAGPANTDGAFISTDGVAWDKLFELNPALNYNWNIRGILHPEPSYWLSVSPVSGTVGAYSTIDLTATFDATELEVGEYTADIHINSNDPTNPVVTIPVTMIVQGVGVDQTSMHHVVMYPVPASNILNVRLDGSFDSMQVFNLMGQITTEVNLSGKQNASVDVSEFNQGIYLVKFISTDGSSFTKKIVIGQ